MALKAEVGLAVAAATGALVYGIFQVEVPNMADVHAAPAHNPFVSRSVNSAGWTAGVAVAGISCSPRTRPCSSSAARSRPT